MKYYEHTATTRAAPETVWAVFERMQFEEWDEDVAEMNKVSGGLEDGTTFELVMNSGQTIKQNWLEKVRPQREFTWAAKFFGGAAKMEAIFTVMPADEGTELKWRFRMYGLVGGLIHRFNTKQNRNGTIMGVKNVKRLAEELEAQGSQSSDSSRG